MIWKEVKGRKSKSPYLQEYSPRIGSTIQKGVITQRKNILTKANEGARLYLDRILKLKAYRKHKL